MGEERCRCCDDGYCRGSDAIRCVGRVFEKWRESLVAPPAMPFGGTVLVRGETDRRRHSSGVIAGDFIVGLDYRGRVSAQVIKCVGITSPPEIYPCYY